MKKLLPPFFGDWKPKPWQRVVILAVIALTIAAFLWPDNLGEPTYHGRSATDWLNNVPGSSEDSEAPDDSIQAFRAMGRPGVRYLAHALEMPANEKVGRAIAYRYQNLPQWLGNGLDKALNLRDEMDYRREHAAWVLRKLGPDANPALPEMLKIFRRADSDDPVTDIVSVALRGMGDKVEFMVPELALALASTNLDHAASCAQILGAIGPKAKPAIPALLMATNGSGWLPEAAAFALWDIDHRTNVVIDVLARTLKYSRQYPAVSGLQELRRRGRALKAAASVVLTALYSPYESDAAESTLQEIDPELLQATIDQLNQNADSILQRTIALIDSEPPKIPSRAFAIVEYFGPQARGAVPGLIEILDRKLPRWLVNPTAPFPPVYEALEALGDIGPASADAVPSLTNLLLSRPSLDSKICQTIASIGPNASNAIPILEPLLVLRPEKPSRGQVNPAPDYSHQVVAALALASIASKPSSNVVEILNQMKRKEQKFWIVDDAYQRGVQHRYPLQWYSLSQALSARIALWKAGLEANPPVTNLTIEISQIHDPNAEQAMIQLLGEIGSPARSALPLLETHLKVGDPFRWAAAIAIHRIDPDEAVRVGLPGLLLAY